MASKRPLSMPVIGWREWIALPLLGVERTKAKIDTGARSSSLHAFDMRQFERDGRTWVRFGIHPLQRSKKDERVVEAPVLEYRHVTSSGGHRTKRPVILTDVVWNEIRLDHRIDAGFARYNGISYVVGAGGRSQPYAG